MELHYLHFFYLFLVHFGKQDSSKQSLSSMQPPEINKAKQCTNAMTVCCDFSYVSGEKSASLTSSTRQKLVPKLSKVWKRMLLFRKSKKRKIKAELIVPYYIILDSALCTSKNYRYFQFWIFLVNLWHARCRPTTTTMVSVNLVVVFQLCRVPHCTAYSLRQFYLTQAKIFFFEK